MIKFILQFSIFLFPLNSFAYEINAMASSGFGFETACFIEINELKVYENYIASREALLERLKDLEPGTKDHSDVQKMLSSSESLVRRQEKTMIELNIGSTLIATVSVILSKGYDLDHSWFFKQIDDSSKLTKMIISPSVLDEETMTFKVSSRVVQVELTSSALCAGYIHGQSLEQAVRSYLDTVFGADSL